MTGEGRSPASSTPIALIDRVARELLAKQSVDDVLQYAVRLANESIGGASSVSIALVDKQRTISTAASSNGLASAGDALQYQFGEGPCLDAVRISDVVHTRDLSVERRWPRWGPTVAADLAVRSMLSLRLYTHQGTMGSVNIYGRDVDAFGPDAMSVAGSFAVQVAAAYERSLDRHHLERALVTRNLIGQAQGILMERHKITAARAFEVLANASQRNNTKLIDVARRVVDTGVSPPHATR